MKDLNEGDVPSRDPHSKPEPPAEPVSTVPNILQRMHAVMRDLTYVAKDRYNQFDKFNFTGHDDVSEALHPLFVRHGIVQVVTVTSSERGEDGSVRIRLSVSWLNVDKAGECVEVDSVGEAMATRKGKDGAFKGDDLQSGKAISYAVKYAQLKNFVLVGGIPDNEEGAGRPVEEPARARIGSEPPPPPASEPISDEQALKMSEEYGAVRTKEHLQKQRKAVAAVMPRLTAEQYKILQKADMMASERVGSVAKETTDGA